MASIFALPLPPYQQPTAGTYIRRITKKRKRKRMQEQEQAQEQEREDGTIRDDAKHSMTSEYAAVITPEERSQRRVAGQPFDQDPPKYPFPHSKKPSLPYGGHRRYTHTTSTLNESSESLRKSREPTLHLRHLGAMTAILHRCLMAKDFGRAGRALSLLLRDKVGGHDVDIRSEGRWGIGAEILLRRRPQNMQNADVVESEIITENDRGVPGTTPVPFYTEAGFEEAKRYYEGLIVQYPFQKLATTAVNALDFYIAMFGLWIFVAHEEFKAAERSENIPLPESALAESASSSVHNAKMRELERAREIAARMDGSMSTYPYSDDLELIRLRGMVALWVADLIDFCSDRRPDEDNVDFHGEPMNRLAANITNLELTGRETSGQDTSSCAVAARSRQLAQDMFNKVHGQASSVE